MLWLAIHIWILLFTAFAIGLCIGWWIWGTRTSDNASSSLLAKEDAPMGTLNIDYDVSAEPDSTPERSL